MVERSESLGHYEMLWDCEYCGTVALLAGGTLGSVANFVATLCYVAATLLVYDLLKPVNRNLSLVAALASLVGCALGILNMFAGLGVPFYAITSLFGLHCLLVGYLILGSIHAYSTSTMRLKAM